MFHPDILVKRRLLQFVFGNKMRWEEIPVRQQLVQSRGALEEYARYFD